MQSPKYPLLRALAVRNLIPASAVMASDAIRSRRNKVTVSTQQSYHYRESETNARGTNASHTNSPSPVWPLYGFTGLLGFSLWASQQDEDIKKNSLFTMMYSMIVADAASNVNYDQVRKDIEAILESNPNYDDGSYAPLLIRLAWHASGTYSKADNSGGSNGATMRFAPESQDGANAGLKLARDLLEPIKKKYGKDLSYADLWTLAGCVAVEAMGGPKIPWKAGRSDAADGTRCPPVGRLPDAAQGQDHVRAVFSRMGFTDQEMVALIGAHAVGRCHTDRSGFTGPWTNSPTVFTNDYYVQLLKNTWTLKKWNGPLQYEDPTGALMMLPADLALIKDPSFKKWVQVYAADQDKFFADFSAAFGKLLSLGVK